MRTALSKRVAIAFLYLRRLNAVNVARENQTERENRREFLTAVRQKALWRDATKRETAHKGATLGSRREEYQSRIEPLEDYFYRRFSFSLALFWSALSRMAYPEIRRDRILDIHSFHDVISTEDTLVLLRASPVRPT